jgi:NAD+-dependent secondary alcohol dehydrogenase Adh1
MPKREPEEEPMGDTQMTAAVLRSLPAAHLDVTKVPAPAVTRPDEIVLQVEACGICGTDLHIMEGRSYKPELPFVLGHEPVGVVVDAGADAAGWLGKRVTITLFTGDGTCAECRAGDERLCSHVVSDTGVFGEWGGYAERLKVHAAQALEAPPELTGPQVASLVDAGATAANSVRVAMARRPERVLILGAGPIGLISAEMLRALGVSVQMTQRSPRRRRVAAEWGYDIVETIAQTDGPFDAVIDCTGSPDVFNDGVAALGPRGAYVLAGYAVVPNADFGEVSHKEATIHGIRSGSRTDLATVLDMAARGDVRLPDITTWPLTEINTALDALRGRQVEGKAVIVPGGGADTP